MNCQGQYAQDDVIENEQCAIMRRVYVQKNNLKQKRLLRDGVDGWVEEGSNSGGQEEIEQDLEQPSESEDPLYDEDDAPFLEQTSEEEGEEEGYAWSRMT